MNDKVKNAFAGVSQETDSELPDPKAAYQAHARVSNKPVFTLHVILGKDGVRSFQYKDIDSNTAWRATDRGQVIELRFGGIRPTEIVLTGRNLWKLYDYIHQHRMPWVMRADRDFSDGSDAIVTGVEFRSIKGDAGE